MSRRYSSNQNRQFNRNYTRSQRQQRRQTRPRPGRTRRPTKGQRAYQVWLFNL